MRLPEDLIGTSGCLAPAGPYRLRRSRASSRALLGVALVVSSTLEVAVMVPVELALLCLDPIVVVDPAAALAGLTDTDLSFSFLKHRNSICVARRVSARVFFTPSSWLFMSSPGRRAYA